MAALSTRPRLFTSGYRRTLGLVTFQVGFGGPGSVAAYCICCQSWKMCGWLGLESFRIFVHRELGHDEPTTDQGSRRVWRKTKPQHCGILLGLFDLILIPL